MMRDRGIASAGADPYAASKIGGDRLAYSYYATFGLPRSSRAAATTTGPTSIREAHPALRDERAQDLPSRVRERQEHARLDSRRRSLRRDARDLADEDMEGETFNIGAGNEKSVLEITSLILDQLKKPKTLVKHVSDRPGHDRRYARTWAS